MLNPCKSEGDYVTLLRQKEKQFEILSLNRKQRI